MSLHIRPQGADVPLYNMARDLAYCYPAMLEDIAKRFNDERWPALVQMAAREGAGFPELCDGMDKLCRFLSLAHQAPEEKMAELLRRSGWLELKPAVQIGINAMMGAAVMGQLFVAIRTLAEIDAPQQPSLQLMTDYARKAKLLAYLPPWRLRLYFAFRGGLRKLRRFWRALNGMVGGNT